MPDSFRVAEVRLKISKRVNLFYLLIFKKFSTLPEVLMKTDKGRFRVPSEVNLTRF